MQYIGAILQELITLAAYILVFAGVHKIYQIATDIREIKEAVQRARSQSGYSAPAPTGNTSSAFQVRPDTEGSLDAANSYAESLLRAVQAQGDGSPSSAESPGTRA